MSKYTVNPAYYSRKTGSNLTFIALVCGLLAASAPGLAGVNPLMAPLPSVKMAPSPSGSADMAAQTGPGLSSPPVPPLSLSHGVASRGGFPLEQEQSQGATVLSAEKWLALAVVTSTVGDRASIVVPLSLTEALAANSTSIPRAPQSNYMPQMTLPGVELKVAATVGQPQVAVQQTRQEILHVRTGKPFFFKGEALAVEVLGSEVTIWRSGPAAKPNTVRDIVYVGSVSSTEMVRSPVVGSFATPDPSVLKRITPTYRTSTSTNSTPSTGTQPATQ